MVQMSVFTAVTTAYALSIIVIAQQNASQNLEMESSTMLMVTSAQCPGKVLTSGHRYRTVGAHSLVECAARCRPDDQCVSIVFEKHNSTCHLSNITASEDCSNMVSAAMGSKYMERAKQMQQVQFDSESAAASDASPITCPDGYYGDYCNITVGGCDELNALGLMTEKKGVYLVKSPQSPVFFPVYCTSLDSGLVRTRVAYRNDHNFNFNRSWQEYRDGFGDPGSSAYWIGLEQLHHLTRFGHYDIRFDVDLENNTNYKQYYSRFVLADESSWYAFSFELPVRDRSLGDCLGDLLGAGFSAYDVDNDNSSVNCAQRHGAGWWFKGDNCSTCNPFGPIIPPYDGWRKGVEGEAFWSHKLGDCLPFEFAAYLVVAD